MRGHRRVPGNQQPQRVNLRANSASWRGFARVAQRIEPGRPKPCGRGFEALRGRRASGRWGRSCCTGRDVSGRPKEAAVDVQSKAKDLRLTGAVQDYIETRLLRLDTIDQKVIDAKFEIRAERNRTGGELMVAQFTIATKGAILRTEEKNRDVHAAIDLAVERMERQIR